MDPTLLASQDKMTPLKILLLRLFIMYTGGFIVFLVWLCYLAYFLPRGNVQDLDPNNPWVRGQ